MYAKRLDRKISLAGSGQERSAGLHVTDVIRECAKLAGIQPQYPKKIGSGNWAEVGFVWEDVVSKVWADRQLSMHLPGEVECDGIIGSPDGLETRPDGSVVLVECKAKWKKAFDPTTDWYWMTQVKSYCWMVGVDRCVMLILWVCGNWNPPEPFAEEWELIFDEDELRKNWEMIVKVARRMEG